MRPWPCAARCPEGLDVKPKLGQKLFYVISRHSMSSYVLRDLGASGAGTALRADVLACWRSACRSTLTRKIIESRGLPSATSDINVCAGLPRRGEPGTTPDLPEGAFEPGLPGLAQSWSSAALRGARRARAMGAIQSVLVPHISRHVY